MLKPNDWKSRAMGARHHLLWKSLFENSCPFDISVVRYFYKIYLVRDMSSASVESLWTVAGWIARDKKRSHSNLSWLEDTVRLHWNGPDPVDELADVKIFDGA